MDEFNFSARISQTLGTWSIKKWIMCFKSDLQCFFHALCPQLVLSNLVPSKSTKFSKNILKKYFQEEKEVDRILRASLGFRTKPNWVWIWTSWSCISPIWFHCPSWTLPKDVCVPRLLRPKFKLWPISHSDWTSVVNLETASTKGLSICKAKQWGVFLYSLINQVEGIWGLKSSLSAYSS